jgi:hypothetical protein
MAYSLDTSYLFDAWSVWHPIDVYDGYWEVMLGAATAGKIFVVDAVREELDRQLPELVYLFDSQAGGWTRAVSEDLDVLTDLNDLERALLAGGIVRSQYPAQNIKKYMAVADPVVVMHARRHDHIVVSKELPDPNNKKSPKLPDLCRHFGVVHASPDEFARVLGYTFTAVARP